MNYKGLDNWTALHFAANEGKLEIVKELLRKQNIDKDAKSTIDRTPLHLAVIRGFIEIVRALIESGANRNSRDFDENTVLHMASEFGHAQIIIYLIKECQADPIQKNKFGYYPPDIA